MASQFSYLRQDKYNKIWAEEKRNFPGNQDQGPRVLSSFLFVIFSAWSSKFAIYRRATDKKKKKIF